MEWFQGLIITVVANVISYYVCKWLDGQKETDKKGNQPEV